MIPAHAWTDTNSVDSVGGPIKNNRRHNTIPTDRKTVCGLTSHNGKVIQRRNLSGRFPLLGRGTQRPAIEPATFKLRVRRANHPTDRRKGSSLPLLHQRSAANWQPLNTKQLSAHQCACEDAITMTKSNPVPRYPPRRRRRRIDIRRLTPPTTAR